MGLESLVREEAGDASRLPDSGGGEGQPFSDCTGGRGEVGVPSLLQCWLAIPSAGVVDGGGGR